MIKFFVMFTFLVMTPLYAHSTPYEYNDGKCVVTRDNGGNVREYNRFGDSIKRKEICKKGLVIDGYCYSACLNLAARARPNVCITKRARFMYHKAYAVPFRRYVDPYGVPKDIDDYIKANGGYYLRFRVIDFEDSLKFWKLCK